MNALNRALRELIAARRSLVASRKTGFGRALIPFVVSLPEDVVPTRFGLEEIEAVIRDAAIDAVARIARGQVNPGQLLARKNVPAELRSQAARSMLAMRGGRATAAKMRPLDYPNLVKAREARRRKAVEQKSVLISNSFQED